ncbi:MAG: DUF2231 domain-containing protein [Candidatus Methylomirabilales bacterium]
MLIHPLVVHFPIALWLASTFFDLMAWWRRDPLFSDAARWLVGLGLLGAVVSIAFGWSDLLAQEAQGVGTALLSRHRVHSLFAYGATLCALANFGWRWRTHNRLSRPLLGLSLLAATLVAVAGYLGGEMRSVM